MVNLLVNFFHQIPEFLPFLSPQRIKNSLQLKPNLLPSFGTGREFWEEALQGLRLQKPRDRAISLEATRDSHTQIIPDHLYFRVWWPAANNVNLFIHFEAIPRKGTIS